MTGLNKLPWRQRRRSFIPSCYCRIPGQICSRSIVWTGCHTSKNTREGEVIHTALTASAWACLIYPFIKPRWRRDSGGLPDRGAYWIDLFTTPWYTFAVNLAKLEWIPNDLPSQSYPYWTWRFNTLWYISAATLWNWIDLFKSYHADTSLLLFKLTYPHHLWIEYSPQNRSQLVKNEHIWRKNLYNVPLDSLISPGCLSTNRKHSFGTICDMEINKLMPHNLEGQNKSYHTDFFLVARNTFIVNY